MPLLAALLKGHPTSSIWLGFTALSDNAPLTLAYHDGPNKAVIWSLLKDLEFVPVALTSDRQRSLEYPINKVDMIVKPPDSNHPPLLGELPQFILFYMHPVRSYLPSPMGPSRSPSKSPRQTTRSRCHPTVVLRGPGVHPSASTLQKAINILQRRRHRVQPETPTSASVAAEGPPETNDNGNPLSPNPFITSPSSLTTPTAVRYAALFGKSADEWTSPALSSPTPAIPRSLRCHLGALSFIKTEIATPIATINHEAVQEFLYPTHGTLLELKLVSELLEIDIPCFDSRSLDRGRWHRSRSFELAG